VKVIAATDPEKNAIFTFRCQGAGGTFSAAAMLYIPAIINR
jgi:hypothetical protein